MQTHPSVSRVHFLQALERVDHLEKAVRVKDVRDRQESATARKQVPDWAKREGKSLRSQLGTFPRAVHLLLSYPS